MDSMKLATQTAKEKPPRCCEHQSGDTENIQPTTIGVICFLIIADLPRKGKGKIENTESKAASVRRMDCPAPPGRGKHIHHQRHGKSRRRGGHGREERPHKGESSEGKENSHTGNR